MWNVGVQLSKGKIVKEHSPGWLVLRDILLNMDGIIYQVYTNNWCANLYK